MIWLVGVGCFLAGVVATLAVAWKLILMVAEKVVLPW